MAAITTQIQDIENQINKSVSGVLSVSASTTIATTDAISVVLVTTGNTNRTITLPAVAANAGRSLLIKKVDSGTGTVTITPNGGTVDGASTNVINAQYSFAELVSDGINWHVINCTDTVTAFNYTPTACAVYASLVNITNLTLPPGRWMIYGFLDTSWSPPVVPDLTMANIATTSLGTGVDTGDGVAYVQLAFASVGGTSVTANPMKSVNLTTATQYWLTGRTRITSGSTTGANYTGRLIAIRS